MKPLTCHQGRKDEKERTGRERAALRVEERAPGRAATFFRAPAGSLASILGMSTSRRTTTRIFESASRASVKLTDLDPGRTRMLLPTNHSLPFCVPAQPPASVAARPVPAVHGGCGTRTALSKRSSSTVFTGQSSVDLDKPSQLQPTCRHIRSILLWSCRSQEPAGSISYIATLRPQRHPYSK